jgi:hypothetical protein
MAFLLGEIAFGKTTLPERSHAFNQLKVEHRVTVFF